MGAEFFHADGETKGQTDKMKLIVARRNYANASKITHIKAVGFASVFLCRIHTSVFNATLLMSKQ